MGHCTFINDLPLQISNSKVSNDLFTDDSSLHTSGKSIQSIETSLQGSFSEISDWCDTSAMILHPAKTKSMVFATRLRHVQPQPTLKKIHIEQENKHCVLGVIIDGEMKWQSQ